MRVEADKALLEADKVRADTVKAWAEAAKVGRERRLAPWTTLLALLGGLSGFFAAGVTLAKYLGG